MCMWIVSSVRSVASYLKRGAVLRAKCESQTWTCELQERLNIDQEESAF